MDEATSAMDNITESQVMGSILSHMKGKTLVIIAHRLKVVENIGKIYAMKNSSYFRELWYASQE